MYSGLLAAHAVRLEPGDDLVPCLLRAAEVAMTRGVPPATTTTNHSTATTGSTTSRPSSPVATSCVVLTAVGSLSSLTVRLANASPSPTQERSSVPFEAAIAPSTIQVLPSDEPAGVDTRDNTPNPSVQLEPSPPSCFRTWNECLEVTSLVGTFAWNPRAAHGSESVAKHLHITVSDGQGRAFGGHLVEGVVHTTLELVLGTLENVDFRREHDPRTGYSELVVTASRPT